MDLNKLVEFKAVVCKNRDANLNSIPIENGQLITVLENEEIYVDLDNKRTLISKTNVVFFESETKRKNYPNPEGDILYVVLSESSVIVTLYIYNTMLKQWVNISGFLNNTVDNNTININQFVDSVFYKSSTYYAPVVTETSFKLSDNVSFKDTISGITNKLVKKYHHQILINDISSITIDNFKYNADTNLILVYINDTKLPTNLYTVTITERLNSNEENVYTTQINYNFKKNKEIDIYIL